MFMINSVKYSRRGLKLKFVANKWIWEGDKKRWGKLFEKKMEREQELGDFVVENIDSARTQYKAI